MSIEPLLAGYKRFLAGDLGRHRARWERLAQGQSPKIMVIACSDSRVDPATIFDAGPGEIFAVRNVANIVPPDLGESGYHGVSAAIEFAVTQLEVSEIVVMGHGQCGGCGAALSHHFDAAAPGAGGYIDRWLDLVAPVRDAVIAQHGAHATTAMEQAVVRMSLDNLRSFPWIAQRERDGRLQLHGAWFAIMQGELHLLDEASGAFAPVR